MLGVEVLVQDLDDRIGPVRFEYDAQVLVLVGWLVSELDVQVTVLMTA